MSACRIFQVLDACCYGVGAISNRHIHPDVVCLCQLCSRERAGFSGWFVHLYGQPVHACLTQLQEQDASFSCGSAVVCFAVWTQLFYGIALVKAVGHWHSV